MIKMCMIQDLCRHFKAGRRLPPNNHVRATEPCAHWIAMDCVKMTALAEVYQYATKEEIACNITKRAKIYKEIKGEK